MLAPSVSADVLPALGVAAGQETVVTSVGGRREITGGGKPANSSNVFFRFSDFDTRNGGINAVKFLNDAGRTNVIAGVSSPTFISVPVELQNRGSLYLLSPLGVQILSGASFVGVDTLMLSTSRRLALGAGVFDALATTDFSSLSASPPADIAGLLSNGLGEGVVGGNFTESDDTAARGIEIASGVSLSVDKSLLIVSNTKPIEIDSSTLSAAGVAAGDALSLVGQSIQVTDSVLKSNALIEIREPARVDSPVAGTLASPTVQSIGCNTQSTCAYLTGRADTQSYLRLTDVVLTDAGSPASAWKSILKVTGWGCRDNGAPCPDNAQVLANTGTNFAQIGATSAGASNPGRRAYRGLNASNVVIEPKSGVVDFDVTISLDWGAIDVLDVISPPTVTTRALRFQTANGSGIAPGDNLVINYAASLGLETSNLTAAELRSLDARVETYALGWSVGKISDTSNSANANVSYSGVWYDGGDATFNNITISFLGSSGVGGGTSTPLPVVVSPAAPVPAAPVPAAPVPAAPVPAAPVPASAPAPAPAPPQARNPAPSSAVTAATAASFDQVLFNFDQTVFSDADASAGVGATTTRPSSGALAVTPGVSLNVSLDEPTVGPGFGDEITPATDQSPASSNPDGNPNASGSDSDPEKEVEDSKSDQPNPSDQPN
jgi:hypothetical protein